VKEVAEMSAGPPSDAQLGPDTSAIGPGTMMEMSRVRWVGVTSAAGAPRVAAGIALRCAVGKIGGILLWFLTIAGSDCPATGAVAAGDGGATVETE
jgi:hypothetical protein